MLVIFYPMLRDQASFAEPSGNFFDHFEPHRLRGYYVKRLERLGYKVALEESITA